MIAALLQQKALARGSEHPFLVGPPEGPESTPRAQEGLPGARAPDLIDRGDVRCLIACGGGGFAAHCPCQGVPKCRLPLIEWTRCWSWTPCRSTACRSCWIQLCAPLTHTQAAQPQMSGVLTCEFRWALGSAGPLHGDSFFDALMSWRLSPAGSSPGRLVAPAVDVCPQCWMVASSWPVHSSSPPKPCRVPSRWDGLATTARPGARRRL